MKTDYSCETTRQEEFRDFQKLREFMRAFEGGNLPKSRWNHAAHLTVAMWYFSLLPAPEAAARVGEGIRLVAGSLTPPTKAQWSTRS